MAKLLSVLGKGELMNFNRFLFSFLNNNDFSAFLVTRSVFDGWPMSSAQELYSDALTHISFVCWYMWVNVLSSYEKRHTNLNLVWSSQLAGRNVSRLNGACILWKARLAFSFFILFYGNFSGALSEAYSFWRCSFCMHKIGRIMIIDRITLSVSSVSAFVHLHFSTGYILDMPKRAC